MHLDLGTAIDRYVVERRLGQGGVATVYRVRHEGLGTVHALKVVHVPSPAITERLLREGRAQGQLRHPNVVAVTDLVSVRGAPGLVMELVPGPSLDRFLEEVPLTLDEADLLARGILAGVAAAHRAGLVHRDLKPGNVLLEVQDHQVVPKIVDFGLAKALTTDSASPLETRAGASLGTPAYMAPEQIDDASSVDERADVFALGAILYELAVGRRAYEADTVPAIYAQIRSGAHGPVPDTLPDRMQRAIRGALSLSPDDRPASVAALAELWAEDTPPPRVTWGTRALEVASAPAISAPSALDTPSTSTFAGEDDNRTTQETWAADDFALQSTVDQTLPPVDPPPSRRPWLALVGGLLAALVIGVGVASLDPHPTDQVLRVDGTPVLADAATQRQFEEAWQAYLDGDFAETSRRLVAVREALPDEPLPHMLASGALMFDGDVPEALDAMTAARTAANLHPEAIGASLARTFHDLQLAGKSVGPPLDAYIDAHPEDYLAKVMRAQYCSTTSDPKVCETSHASLLAHDDQQIVAHHARARSWLDLGELARVREAAEDGLAIDPAEPGLLALYGNAWMAEGAHDRAREAFERALKADPRENGPKLSLAKLSLLSDDGTWDVRTAELLAPTVPAEQRTSVHTEAAETLLAIGRPHAALAHLDQALAIEREEGSALGVLTVMSLRSPALQMLEQPEAISTLIDDQLALIAGAPEIPNPVRNRYAAYRPWTDGMIAAKAGDRAGVAQALDRVQRAEVPQKGVVEALSRELAVLDGDVDGIAAHATFFWTTCDRQAALGGAYRRAGALDLAEQAWQAVLDAPCRLHRPERAKRVGALVGLAELRSGSERDALVAEARALWPAPEPDVPLAQRLAALTPP
ncbi:MAG: serine/threonine protein kinase [Deltaproteobacteria bacterium]|nr:MAG: serine/threonine protein kinase [Deltaproteobacteria bacterium]